MSDSCQLLGCYLHLAQACDLRRQPLERGKMLVMAGVTSAEMGLNPIAAYCRRKILANNPGHLVGQFRSFSVALQDERFQGYLRQLQRNFPREKLEHMLASLGIELGNERDTYESDYEYAAGLLGMTPSAMEAALRKIEPPPEGHTEIEERRTNWGLVALMVAALGSIVGWTIWRLTM